MKKSNLLSITAAIVLLVCSSIAFAGKIPDTGDPSEPACNPRSFTDLGNGIIMDNVTGLMWQKDTAPGTYTWKQARSYCSSLTLGGYTDWRLPTIQELSNLTDSSIPSPGPAINTSYFPDTMASYYWSATASARGLFKAWRVDFSDGYVNYNGKRNVLYVRAVRGAASSNNFIDNGDGTITDTSTGLMWEKATSANTYTWTQAKDYCENLTLGGKSGWRLPTRNELQTLVNYGRYNPAFSMNFYPSLRKSYFPGTVPSYYWTSTTSATSSGIAWYVHFKYGYVHYIDKMLYNYVRAVRAEQCGASGP